MAFCPPMVAVVDEVNPLPRTVTAVPGDTVVRLKDPTESGAFPRSTIVSPG